MKPKVKHCDFFGTVNPASGLRIPINAVQKWNSKDKQSVYSHSGIIMNPDGDIIEALWEVEANNLFTRYAGCPVIIARYVGLTDLAWEDAALKLMDKIGQNYPWWRLGLFLYPPVARRLNLSNKEVCSELVAKVEWWIGARHECWAGTCPDTLADEWHRWRDFEVVFEGVLAK